MESKHLNILFDTDTVSADQIMELEKFGSSLMDLYQKKINDMGLHIVDNVCVTKK